MGREQQQLVCGACQIRSFRVNHSLSSSVMDYSRSCSLSLSLTSDFLTHFLFICLFLQLFYYLAHLKSHLIKNCSITQKRKCGYFISSTLIILFEYCRFFFINDLGLGNKVQSILQPSTLRDGLLTVRVMKFSSVRSADIRVHRLHAAQFMCLCRQCALLRIH